MTSKNTTTGAAKAAPKPKSQKPETVEPETVEPESQKPETVEPESQKPETVEPESQKPETVEPETQKPETVEPETVEDATEGAEERDGHPLTITDEATYHEVVSRYALPINGYELGGFNGVIDSRYELTEGQVIYLPWPLPEPTA